MFIVKSLGVRAVVYDLHWDIDFLCEIYGENKHENVPEKGGTAKKGRDSETRQLNTVGRCWELETTANQKYLMFMLNCESWIRTRF